LGTAFTVNAFENPGYVFVQLYEGEVVVKVVIKTAYGLRRYYAYILPGQTYRYISLNAGLGKLFEELAKVYHVDILYEKKDVAHMYSPVFVSQASDSIEYILTEIAAQNNLTVTRKDNKFIISK